MFRCYHKKPVPVYTVLRVFKKDIFGEVQLVRLEGDNRMAVCRNFGRAVWLLRPLAARLAKREINFLQKLHTLAPGQLPEPIYYGSDISLRSYFDGAPLKDMPTVPPEFYESALRLVKTIHNARVVHNDLEKPENWIVTNTGLPALVDFQIALSLPFKRIFQMLAYEDIRHIYKQKKRYCPLALTEEENEILERRSALGRWWKKYFKPLYNFVTRRLLHYSDGAHSRYSR
ncbi:MAG: hypothetical protein NZM35_05595 [Chitinophagales bacterium]|nr:hypothetical protein [Chitinophagales bacterium]MDW8418913.1 hypothetical protein [Chitinophagales bacterium]